MNRILKVYLTVVISICALSCENDKNDALPQNPNAQLLTNVKTNLTKHSKIAVDTEKNGLNIIFGRKCYTINYPVSFTNNQNDNVKVVKNNTDFHSLIFGFSVTAQLSIKYPIKVTLDNGNQSTINSIKEHTDLNKTCKEECNNCVENCFTIAYPIKLIKADKTIVTINTSQESLSFLEGLKSDELFTISYPLSIIQKGGNQQTIKNDEELDTLFKKCFVQ